MPMTQASWEVHARSVITKPNMDLGIQLAQKHELLLRVLGSSSEKAVLSS